MTISFPIPADELAELFAPGMFTMDLDSNQMESGLASGETIAVQHGPMLWGGTAKTIGLLHGQAQAFAARLRALDGSIQPFFLYDVRMCFPALDNNGSIFGAATPTIAAVGGNNKSIGITGLPANYVLSVGDRWAADYNSTRRFYGEFSEAVTADGSGDVASIEVRPHLRPGFAGSVPIYLVRAAAKVKIKRASLRVTQVSTFKSAVSFAFQQTLAQD